MKQLILCSILLTAGMAMAQRGTRDWQRLDAPQNTNSNPVPAAQTIYPQRDHAHPWRNPDQTNYSSSSTSEKPSYAQGQLIITTHETFLHIHVNVDSKGVYGSPLAQINFPDKGITKLTLAKSGHNIVLMVDSTGEWETENPDDEAYFTVNTTNE